MTAKQNLEKAFELLSKIPVAGQYVDIMAAARSELRTAYKQIEVEKDGGQDNR
jgi:hypothetical protein